MNRKITLSIVCLCALIWSSKEGKAQITLLQDYINTNSATIGTFQGITFREAGFSGLYPIPGTNGKEFWVCSDRGVNVDAATANPSGCTPTYDKIYAFPSYAPKIHRVRINGNSLQILQTITIKRPNGSNASGIINPTGLGSTATEVASTDTVLDCANFNLKTTPKDTFGIDSEGLIADRDGNFWICEEGGPTIWKVNPNGVLLKRYTPYANLPGAQSVDVQIDTVFKYRKNNRGFEGIALAPNGKIYAIIQSPVLYPTKSVGEGTRIHRILEIDPVTNVQRMYAYLNDGIIGASGSNQIRLRDWKIGDMAAINDSTFLVLEAAIRGTSDYRRMYLVNINGATAVHSGLYGGLTLEALVDSTGLANNNIKPVRKTLVMDLLANSWPAALDKAEGLAILNDSTIAICNDNDYGQFSPLENGIATATTNLSHLFIYRLSGANKLSNFNTFAPFLNAGVTGNQTFQSPYLVPTVPQAQFTSVLSAGDTAGGYKLCGLGDGMGAFDNGNGTFTVLINHEMANTAGVNRAHGQKGAFVSKWVLNKSDLSVVSGSDLIKNVYLWNGSSYTLYNSSNPSPLTAFSRFCAADLPEVSAFYNAATGLGTQERLFMNGEEAGNEGRGFAHIVTGVNAGTTYELPALGKFSWENAVASPGSGNKTVVVGLDDATPGQVYIYVGNKTASGSEVVKAGLTNGKLYGVSVAGMFNETSTSVIAPNSTFTLVDLGNVQSMTGSSINSLSNSKGVTNFLRPEDGAWDPMNPNDFYFVTTNSFTSPSRLYRLRFNNVQAPEQGGTITAVLDGTEGQVMMDNMVIDNYGNILIQEDPGNQSYLAKIWQYNTGNDMLTRIAQHDSVRFLIGTSGYMTQDEESSGIIDMQGILGPGMFMLYDQAHYGISGEVVEGGQLLSFFNPSTYNASPEINLAGNGISIPDGNNTPSATDNTDFGKVAGVQIKSLAIQNAGPGTLTVKGITISGTHAGDFSVVAPTSFPLTIASGASQTITVKFTPGTTGVRNGVINISTNDFDEGLYDFAVSGTGVDAGVTGLSSSQSPYLIPSITGANFTSLLTVGDAVNNYKMCGLGDGLGAFDNGNGTFTLLMNHEMNGSQGVVRAHGAAGAFVSKWVINKSNLSVVSGSDLIKNVYLWNGTGYSLYNASNPTALLTLNRFCAADLPEVSAFYNQATGKGTTERIFMNGEESGNEGRAFGHIATGINSGSSYELPRLGKFSWENSVANPFESDKTIVAGMDDATPGQVYIYIGTKTNTGTEVEKAGLTNGKLYGVAVTGLTSESSASVPSENAVFTLVDLGNVEGSTGAALNTNSNNMGVTNFLRPEDGAWDPMNPNDFYFVTTNSFTAPSRLWRLRFTNVAMPELGGTITAVLDGTEGQKMLDNMVIDHYGHILLQEDPGNQSYLAKMWQYTIATDALVAIAEHEQTRFTTGSSNYLTQDEEVSGIIDMQGILGAGMFIVVDQAHYGIPGELVEGGQLLAFYNPETFRSNPEVSIWGNNTLIVDGDMLPEVSDNTDFGKTETGTTITKTFIAKNTGVGKLNISGVQITGANSNEFIVVNSALFPVVLTSGETFTFDVKFTAGTTEKSIAQLEVKSNDYDEAIYNVQLTAASGTPEIEVSGNGIIIVSGDMTPEAMDNTDFGNIRTGTSEVRSYRIDNKGNNTLRITSLIVNGPAAADFTILNTPVLPLVIEQGSSFTLAVKFTPSIPGTRMAGINFVSNDLNETAYGFAISGNGVLPAIEVRGNNVVIADGDLTPSATDHTDLGITNKGAFLYKSFTIQNPGSDKLVINGINFTGTHAGDFSLSGTVVFPIIIPAGGYVNTMVQFAPSAIGMRYASLHIMNDDQTRSDYDFAVQGMGLSALATNSVAAITDVSLYPNPANNELKVSFKNGKEQQVTIVVTDLQGKVIYNAEQSDVAAGSQQININTSDMANGFYFVKVSAGNLTKVVKVVILH